ncbi:MAG: mandelate racemase/muconate lactonizing enzyme family protein [Anaerolineae bacterium]
MKIKAVRPFLVGHSLLVRVYTDVGIVGTGEAGLWAHLRWVLAAIEDLSAYYVGKDPTTMEHHYQVLARNTHFSGPVLNAALSAMDIAMWDILARSLDLPIYALLGGQVRERIKVFANVAGDTLDARAESASQQVAFGFTSLRTIPMFPGFERQDTTKTIKDAVAIVRAIREAVGDEIDLGLEIHRNLAPDGAVLLARELAPYRILYYEDPVPPESLEALKYVAQHIDIPIATGERNHSLYQFKSLIDSQTVAMVRPDPSLVGGYTQAKKIAGMAEAAFVGVFPHLMGSPVNTAAFCQFAASVPNYRLMEVNDAATHPLNEILETPLEVSDGHILLPRGPGIGVEVREERLARFPFLERGLAGNLHADGSVAH